MTCCTASSLAAASIAFSGAVLGLGPTSAECALDSQTCLATSLPSARCADTPSDGFALLRKFSEREGVGDGAGLVVSRLATPRERAASGFGLSTARLWNKAERDGVPVWGRWPYDAFAAPGLGTVNTNPIGRNPDRSSPYRFTKTAAISNQLPVATPETLGKVSTAVVGRISQSNGGRYDSLGINGYSAREESRPGPYAMLVIGLSLAAFMAIRRMGHG